MDPERTCSGSLSFARQRHRNAPTFPSDEPAFLQISRPVTSKSRGGGDSGCGWTDQPKRMRGFRGNSKIEPSSRPKEPGEAVDCLCAFPCAYDTSRIEAWLKSPGGDIRSILDATERKEFPLWSPKSGRGANPAFKSDQYLKPDANRRHPRLPLDPG